MNVHLLCWSGEKRIFAVEEKALGGRKPATSERFSFLSRIVSREEKTNLIHIPGWPT